MGMVSIYLPEVRFCHCEERNDEAIPQASEIASLRSQ